MIAFCFVALDFLKWNRNIQTHVGDQEIITNRNKKKKKVET